MSLETEDQISGGKSYRAVVRNIVQGNEPSNNLKEPYVVTSSPSVEGSITFSLSLWNEDYLLSVGDEVLLINVHSKRVRAKGGGFRTGWRAEGVEAISPSTSEKNNENVNV